MSDISKWEPAIQDTIEKIQNALSHLHKIWEETGFTEEIRTIYCEQAFNHINKLLNDMIAESEVKKKKILSNVKELMKQIAVLVKELGTDIETNKYEDLPLTDVEQVLIADLHKLEYCKEQRIVHLKELLAKEKCLCRLLGTQPNLEEKLPSKEDLNSFELYLKKQKAEKNRLEAIFNKMRRTTVRRRSTRKCK